MNIAVGYCLRMPTIDDIRHANLLKLIVERGGQRALAETIGKAPAQISQWVTKAPNQRGTARAISSASARAIEKALGLPSAWMDQPQSPDSITAPMDAFERIHGNTPASPAASPGAMAADLIPMATPKTRGALEAIVQAAREGTLTEADLLLLESIARRLAQATPQPGHNAKALKRIRRGPESSG